MLTKRAHTEPMPRELDEATSARRERPAARLPPAAATLIDRPRFDALAGEATPLASRRLPTPRPPQGRPVRAPSAEGEATGFSGQAAERVARVAVAARLASQELARRGAVRAQADQAIRAELQADPFAKRFPSAHGALAEAVLTRARTGAQVRQMVEAALPRPQTVAALEVLRERHHAGQPPSPELVSRYLQVVHRDPALAQAEKYCASALLQQLAAAPKGRSIDELIDAGVFRNEPYAAR